MQKSTKIIAVLVILVLIGSSIGLYFFNEKTETENKVLTVAVSPDYTNYEYLYGPQNDYAGIDIDLMYSICQEIGYKFNPVTVPFNEILDGVAAGKYDVGASSFTITDDRKEIVNFSSHYDESGLVVIAKTDRNFKSQNQLYSARIAVQEGTVGEKFLMETEGFNKDKIVLCASTSSAINAILKNSADCAVIDKVNADSLSLEQIGMKTLNILDYTDTQFFGFAVSKENTGLLDKVDGALEKLIANGTLAKIKIYYSDSYCMKMPYYQYQRQNTA